MCLKVTLKVTKNQGLTLSLEDTIFGKPQGMGSQIDSFPVVLGLTVNCADQCNGEWLSCAKQVLFMFLLILLWKLL